MKMFTNKRNQDNKGVIINVYTETSSQNRKNAPFKGNYPNPISSENATTTGYDRRRQLLEYAQELRHGNHLQSQGDLKDSKPKKKRWRWSLPVQRIKLLFSRICRKPRGGKYERIITENYSDDEGSGNQERRKTKSNGRKSDSHFCKKLKFFLKEISHAMQCKRGD